MAPFFLDAKGELCFIFARMKISVLLISCFLLQNHAL